MAGDVNYGLVNPAVLDYAGQEQKYLGAQKARMEVSELGRAIEQQNQLNEYIKSGADLSSQEGRNKLLNYGKMGMGYSKALTEQDKSTAETQKLKGDAKKQSLDFVFQGARNMAANPSPENIIAWGQDAVLNGYGTPESVEREVRQLIAMSPEKRSIYLSSLGAQTKDLINQYQMSLNQKETLAERIRNNKVTEGISYGNLDIARQNQQRGAIPAGYRMTTEGTLEAIPGGPTTTNLSPKEMQARESKYPVATQAVNTFEAKTDQLEKDLITLRNHPGLSSITGIVAGRAPAVTSQGREAQALYDKIVARGGFKELQDMRAASPTGGALGNVSNQEGAQLRQSFAAIDRRQDAPSIQKAIDDAVSDLQGSKARVREAYDMTYDYKGTKAPPKAPSAGNSNIDALLEKYK